jgi:hypothetical protein
MTTAMHAILSLSRRFMHECKRLRTNERELKKLSDAYFRYRDLLHEQGEIRAQILKIFGVLGVQAPDVTPELASLIAPKPINSLEVRRDLELKLWEVLELFLSSVDNRATVGEFQGFVRTLDWRSVATAQAIDSALKSHPELFEEEFEGREKFLVLKESVAKD